MKKFKKALLIFAMAAVPFVAYAASNSLRVTVNNAPTNYRAITVNGTTYLAVRDVADLTGREVTYNARTKTVNISGESRGTTGARQQGGTTQRSGSEGNVGQLITIPELSVRVDNVTHFSEYGSDLTAINGIIRNTSKGSKSYSFDKGVLALKNGQQLQQLDSYFVNGGHGDLERGEEAEFRVIFKGTHTPQDADRLVLTIAAGQYSAGPQKVVRVYFPG